MIRKCDDERGGDDDWSLTWFSSKAVNDVWLKDATVWLTSVVKAVSFGTKRVRPMASWRNSRAVSFVPFDDGIWKLDNKFKVLVAFVAFSAVEMLPGGINTPLIWLMNKFLNHLASTTVTFWLASISELNSQFLSKWIEGRKNESLPTKRKWLNERIIERENIHLVQDGNIAVLATPRPC